MAVENSNEVGGGVKVHYVYGFNGCEHMVRGVLSFVEGLSDKPESCPTGKLVFCSRFPNCLYHVFVSYDRQANSFSVSMPQGGEDSCKSDMQKLLRRAKKYDLRIKEAEEMKWKSD